MPYTENFAELRFGGPAWSGQETWSCGLKLKHIGGDAGPAMQDDIRATIEAVAAAVEDYFTDTTAMFSAGIQLEWVRLNVISAATGRYLYPNDPQIFEYDSPVVPPSQSSGGTPNRGYPQIAYCVTQRGTLRRGPGSRGRWYVPVCLTPGELITSTGVMPISVAQYLADAAGTFLSALSTISAGEGPDPWSPWLYGDGETGAADSAVSTVSVGNVYDTQRRRRAQLEETYALATTWDPVNG